MLEHGSDAELFQGLREGHPQAAAQLFERYTQRLIRLAEQHLSQKLAGRLDGEDVVQSVFRTFFRRSVEREFRIDSTAQIWRLLMKITLMKTRAKGRYHTAQSRDAKAEVLAGDDGWMVACVSGEPGPSEAAELTDQIEVLLEGLPTLYGSVLEMRLRGCSVSEIAPTLGVSQRTVQRALKLLQDRLSKIESSIRP
jgi:RNA polymerase sigma-70 factor, ECF subfamily